MSSRKLTEEDLIAALTRVNQADNPNTDRKNCLDRITLEAIAFASAGDIRIEESAYCILVPVGPVRKN